MKAAIIGGGMIGAGWARLLMAHGHQVRIYDEAPDRCHQAATLAEAVTGADLVMEAITEQEEAKRAALAAAGQLALPTALIASSSSSILPSRLQAAVSFPERMLVLHPLHPVDLLPVVEVVPGGETSPETVERACALLVSLGKRPVVLRREVAGYVVNRLAGALWREAIDLVLSGVVDAATLDTAASLGPCLGWAVQGPFLTYELAAPGGIGPFLDHLQPAFHAIWESLATWDALSPEQVSRLEAATKKAYGNQARSELEAERDQLLRAILSARGQA